MKRTLKRESKVLEIAEIEGMASSIGRGIWPARTLARRVRNWLLPLRACRRRRPSRSCPPASVRMDSRWSRRGPGRWPSPRGRTLQPGPNGSPGIEVRKPLCLSGAAGGPVQWSAGVGGMQCFASAAGRHHARSAHCCVFGILTKWLSFTRLETRTKESYIYASDRVGNSFAE